jgi:CubicO group peptidase (beta-lactamase class C family)
MVNGMLEPEEVGMSTQRLNRIKPVLQSYIDNGIIAGMSTLVARKGKPVHFEQLGLMDKELGKPMASDTIFRIYSMTKPIIATALMTLFEKGRFQLFDPVSKFLPVIEKTTVLEGSSTEKKTESSLARPVTMLDLFTHTAGLTYDFLEDFYVCEMYREAKLINDASRSLEAFVDELLRIPLAFQPGTRWHYSFSIDVLAYIIQVIADKPLGDFLAEEVFGPLNMIDTGFVVPEEKRDRLATVYGLPDICERNMTASKAFEAWQQGFNEKIDVSATYPVDQPDWARGGLGLFSTAPDYLRFAQMLLNWGELDGVRLLSRKTLELMHTNHLPAKLLPWELAGIYYSGYGFGLGSRVLLNVAESQKPGSIGEFGWAGAANTYYWIDPVEELIGILMMQYMFGMELPDRDFQALAYQAIID